MVLLLPRPKAGDEARSVRALSIASSLVQTGGDETPELE
jgi:hypothetical protein